MKIPRLLLFLFSMLCMIAESQTQHVLLGENPPHGNRFDGDFRLLWDYWRNASQSPYWNTRAVQGDQAMGLHYGTLFSSNEVGLAESDILNGNPNYQHPKAGDILEWSFGADLEYMSKGSISLSLVFGDLERVLAEKVKLIGADQKAEHFNGNYELNEEDARAGLPLVRATFYSEQDVKVYLHYVNISVVDPDYDQVTLRAEIKPAGILLSWKDESSKSGNNFYVYRSGEKDNKYLKIGETGNINYLDSTLINGVEYQYLVTRSKEAEPRSSNIVAISKNDAIPPAPPARPATEIYDTEVRLDWKRNKERDVASYSVYRGDSSGNQMIKIASGITKNWYEDILIEKGKTCSYVIYAHDFSGNRSEASEAIKAKVKAVFGASFSDLILPMQIHKGLSSDLWGAKGVIPRDPENGIEDAAWSYWGGRPVKDRDEKYHMLVTRWPEGALKGHWEWPNSTVAHVVSEQASGPYLVEKEIAYSFKNGLGHNPDIILLNDGTYALYSLIEWEPTIFTSASMSGPWKREGIMSIDMESADSSDTRFYQYSRNLSGVQLDDDRVLMVSKFGCMMISESGLLGPYKVLTKTIHYNQSIPGRYRKSNYEDPVMWKDEVQFHLLINAFLDYRAIYLRSPDGIHWKYDPGLAYTPDFTSYEDGSRTRWYKLERPHVLQDKYGRATHLSLAVIDVPKKDDYANDSHNSKNIIIPLRVHKRIQMLNREKISPDTKKIKILILSEQDFDAQKDIDILSLRFGASEEVNFGRGSKVRKVKRKGKDLIIEFYGTGNGISDENFAGKLLGKTTDGELLLGFVELKAD